jgi:hypothetical protein
VYSVLRRRSFFYRSWKFSWIILWSILSGVKGYSNGIFSNSSRTLFGKISDFMNSSIKIQVSCFNLNHFDRQVVVLSCLASTLLTMSMRFHCADHNKSPLTLLICCKKPRCFFSTIKQNDWFSSTFFTVFR